MNLKPREHFERWWNGHHIDWKHSQKNAKERLRKAFYAGMQSRPQQQAPTESPESMIAEGLEQLKGGRQLIQLSVRINKKLRDMKQPYAVPPFVLYAIIEVCKEKGEQ